jgi:hypothetical protein
MKSGFVHTIVIDGEVLVLHYVPEDPGCYKVVVLNNPAITFDLKHQNQSWLIASEVQDLIKTAEAQIVEGLVTQIN